jgi:hypothetical protein
MLHSANNATVCSPLRGASRLGRRRKGIAESIRLRGTQRGPGHRHGASDRSRRRRGRPAWQLQSPWQQGRRPPNRKGSRTRASGNGPTSAEFTPFWLPCFRKAAERVSTRSIGTLFRPGDSGWLLRALFRRNSFAFGSARLARFPRVAQPMAVAATRVGQYHRSGSTAP